MREIEQVRGLRIRARIETRAGQHRQATALMPLRGVVGGKLQPGGDTREQAPHGLQMGMRSPSLRQHGLDRHLPLERPLLQRLQDRPGHTGGEVAPKRALRRRVSRKPGAGPGRARFGASLAGPGRDSADTGQGLQKGAAGPGSGQKHRPELKPQAPARRIGYYAIVAQP